MAASPPRRPPGEPYELDRDYRTYEIKDLDRPFLRTGTAADILGVKAETIREYVRCGKLPGTRGDTAPGSKRSPAVLVPQWAVVGRHELTARAETPEAQEYRLRTRSLEDALVALRQAEEHARRARDLSRQAEAEWEAALATLSDATAQVLAPETAMGVTS